MRTDIHRPSVIDPKDYDLIGYDYLGSSIEMIEATKDDRKEIKEFCITRGVSYEDCLDKLTSQCQCCGAHALYYGVFYHRPSNVIVWLGHICAYKMGLVKKGDFVQYRKGLNTRIVHIQNVEKARKFCVEQGINIERFAQVDGGSWEQKTLKTMWFNLIQYHTLTEKQVAFCKKLIDKVDNPIVVEEKHRDVAIDGRHEVSGKVLGFKEQESQFGITLKALIETDKGWKLYVTVPSGAEWQKEDLVKIVVTVEVSKDDPYFAFGKRPKLVKV